jgi:hypothetical protein
MQMEMVDEDDFPTIKPTLHELSKKLYESLVDWFYLWIPIGIKSWSHCYYFAIFCEVYVHMFY